MQNAVGERTRTGIIVPGLSAHHFKLFSPSPIGRGFWYFLPNLCQAQWAGRTLRLGCKDQNPLGRPQVDVCLGRECVRFLSGQKRMGEGGRAKTKSQTEEGMQPPLS